VVPDQLRELTEVVVAGKLVNGRFEADTLIARCPDRYGR
jgi:cytochrome c-type biogenesis protein CcmE